MTPIEYIRQHYHLNPTAKTKLQLIHHRYLASLDPEDQRSWPRWRFVAVLSEQFVLGQDARGVLHVAGISEQPPLQWAVDQAGRLTRT